MSKSHVRPAHERVTDGLVLAALDHLGGSAYEGELVDKVCELVDARDEESPDVARAVHARLAAPAQDRMVRRKAAAAGQLWLTARNPE